MTSGVSKPNGKTNHQKYRFRTRLFKGGEAANSSTFAAMEFDSVTAFGKKGRVAVQGKINGFAFRNTLMPYNGRHLLTVNKEMQTGAKATAGMEVDLEIALDTKPRTVKVPKDLAIALKTSTPANRQWLKLAPSHQKEYIKLIVEAKKADTRERRLKKVIEMLSSGVKSPKV